MEIVQAGGQNFYAEKIPDVPTGAPQEHPTPDAPEPSAEGEAKVAVQYTLHGDGSLQMDWHIDATNVLPAPLPLGLFSCVLSLDLLHRIAHSLWQSLMAWNEGA